MPLLNNKNAMSSIDGRDSAEDQTHWKITVGLDWTLSKKRKEGGEKNTQGLLI